MYMIDKYLFTRKTGFALIMSLLVVSVVITAGLTILDVSIKQVRLSGNAKDSEIAFSATSAGLECGRYWRRSLSNAMENTNGGTPDTAVGITCFQRPAINVTPVEVTGVTNNGRAYVYDYEFTWGTGVDARCTKITTMVIMSTSSATSSIRIEASPPNDNMLMFIPGYPDNAALATEFKNCPPAGICTVISSRGYNRSCTPASINSPGTIEREVLLEY
jgi:Tfp pilus assembly protein PilX